MKTKLDQEIEEIRQELINDPLIDEDAKKIIIDLKKFNEDFSRQVKRWIKLMKNDK